MVPAVALWAWFSVLAPSVHGQEVVATARIETSALAGATSLATPDNSFALELPVGALTVSATLQLQSGPFDQVALPGGQKAISSYWVYDLRLDQPAKLKRVIRLTLHYASDGYAQRSVYIGTGKGWKRLPSTDRPKEQTITATVGLPFGQVVVLENTQRLEGIASWYRSSRYPYGAAANILPMGSRVRVVNVSNNKSVVVTIVSRGPYVKGRIIDLSHTAFAAIAPRGAGLAQVRLEPLNGAQVAPPPSSTPTVSAAVGVVVDPQTGAVLWSKGTTSARPIASISKLMTALVFLETNPNFDRVFTMAKEDLPQPEAGVGINVPAGGRITVGDLFSSMLTASANNATLALVRSTGLTREDFVERMNAKAKALGYTQMHFDDPTGLAVGNVATSTEVAGLVQTATANDLIRKATTRRTYTYTLLPAGTRHAVRNPVYLYNHLLDASPIVGAKTGFINEAGHCIALVAKGATGKLFSVVVLGSPTTTTRSQDAKTLVDWAVNRF